MYLCLCVCVCVCVFVCVCWGGEVKWLSESVKKGKFVTKIFFSDINVELNSKNLWKIISADVKAHKNKKYKIWWLCLSNFYKKYLQNLKYIEKNGIYFSFDFGWCCVHLDIAHQGGGFFLLNRQNLLRVTGYLLTVPYLREKVGQWQSLISNCYFNLCISSWEMNQKMPFYHKTVLSHKQHRLG